MSMFINQLFGGVGKMFGGAVDIVSSPLALIGDICGGFGSQQSNQWMGNQQQGACACGAGAYGPQGNYQHEMTQNARLSNLERRLAYDEAVVNLRGARGCF